jgi:O-antigen/teichoic acid export membrane protein
MAKYLPAAEDSDVPPAPSTSVGGKRQGQREANARPSTRFGAVVAKLASVNALVVGFSLLTGPLLARSLGPSGRGAVAAAAAPPALAPALLGLGLPTFVTREAAKETPTGDLLLSVGLFCLVIGGLVIGLSDPIANYFAQGREAVRVGLQIGCYTMPLALFGTLLLGIANGQQRWNIVLAARIIPALIALLGTVGLYMTGLLGVPEAIALILLGGFASIAPTLAVLKGVRIARLRPALVMRSLKFGIPSWLWQISSITNARLDQVLMVSLTTSAQLGLYAVAVSLAGISNVFTSTLGPALLPRVTRGDAHLVPRACSATLLLSGVVNVALAICCPLMLPLLFGQRFHAAVTMAWLLCAAAIPSAGTQVLTAALLSVNRPRYVAFSEFMAVGITVGGLVILVGPLGGVGAAWVSLVAYSLTFCLLLVGARAHFDESYLTFLLPKKGDLGPQIGLAKASLLRIVMRRPVG